MPECRVTLSTNAGVSLEFKTKKIWVDAVSDSNPMGFSFLTQEMWERLKNDERFADPDVICFTHCHGDHFSEKYTREAVGMWPEAKVIIPEQFLEGQILVEKDGLIPIDRSLNVEYHRLQHEGSMFANSIHYGILIEYYGYTMLIPGDCSVGSEELGKWINKRRINAVLLDFPWITCEAGRKFVAEVIRPEYAIVCHLPRAVNDKFGYREAAKKGIALLNKDITALLLSDDFTSVFLNW